MPLGFSQTIGKLIRADRSVVSYVETLESEILAILTMSFTDFIMSQTFDWNGLQELATFRAF